MPASLVVEIPHTLGKAEARRRLRERVGALASRIPGGAEISSSWPAEDRMTLDIRAMGQTVAATLDVEETLIRATIALPLMLGMMSGHIAKLVRETGSKLLLSDDRA